MKKEKNVTNNLFKWSVYMVGVVAAAGLPEYLFYHFNQLIDQMINQLGINIR